MSAGSAAALFIILHTSLMKYTSLHQVKHPEAMVRLGCNLVYKQTRDGYVNDLIYKWLA